MAALSDRRGSCPGLQTATRGPSFSLFRSVALFSQRLGLRQMLSREGIVTQDYCSLQQVAPQVVISTCAQTRGNLTYMHVGLVERFCLVSKRR